MSVHLRICIRVHAHMNCSVLNSYSSTYVHSVKSKGVCFSTRTCITCTVHTYVASVHVLVVAVQSSIRGICVCLRSNLTRCDLKTQSGHNLLPTYVCTYVRIDVCGQFMLRLC